jgi:site-specific DNA-methyltransferase (adenine-specific)
MRTLYYGDNLDILRRYLTDELVDQVCLDPPFNSAQTYNVFFQEKDGSAAVSQIKAFAQAQAQAPKAIWLANPGFSRLEPPPTYG